MIENERGRPSEKDRPANAEHLESPNPSARTTLHEALQVGVAPHDPPPDTLTQSRFAIAVCQADTFHVLKSDGSNTAEPGLISVEAAVVDGRPYFGVVHPWVWAIDVDQPSHPSYATLLTFLDANDIEYVETDSGSSERSGRHVFAYVPETEPYRRTIAEAVAMVHHDATSALDYRPSGTIRPPMAPHRHGGWSRPLLDPIEALEIVEGWHLAEAGPMPPTTGGRALPGWAVFLLDGKYNEAEQLGHRVRRNGNRIDRSAVDLSLALAFRNAGMQQNDFLAARMAGGSHPSPKAVAVPAQADVYLRKQWAEALKRPMPVSRIRDGLDRLEEFERAVEAWTGFKRPRAAKAVLTAMIDKAREIGKTMFNLDQRTLSEISGIGLQSVCSVLADLSKFVERLPSAAINGLSADEEHTTSRFRLRILEVLAEQKGAFTEHADRTVGDLLVCSVVAPLHVARTHPVFCNVGRGLGGTGFETLKCFSRTEARTQAQAMRLRVDVCERTFKDKCDRLRRLGVLIPSEGKPKQLLLAEDVDWDDVANHLEVAGNLGRRQQRYEADRIEQTHYRLHNGEVSAAEAVKAFANIKQRETQRENNARHKTFDPQTGLAVWKTKVELASSQRSAAKGATRMNCVCCGLPTERREPSCHLPWHQGCLLQPWIVRALDVGDLVVPADLVAWPRPVTDPYAIDEMCVA